MLRRFHNFRLPPAYVLTLAETPERERFALQHLNDELGFSARPFHGFHGKRMGLGSVQNKMTQGMLGCQLGHMALWQALASSEHEAFLIFEDDVLLPAGALATMAQAYTKALPPDWNMTYWGYCWCNLDARRVVNKSFDLVTWPPLCLHAYMIKRSTARALLPRLTCDAPIDVQIRPLLNELGGIYAYSDPLFAQQRSLVYTAPGELNVPVVAVDDGLFRSQTCERKTC